MKSFSQLFSRLQQQATARQKVRICSQHFFYHQIMCWVIKKKEFKFPTHRKGAKRRKIKSFALGTVHVIIIMTWLQHPLDTVENRKNFCIIYLNFIIFAYFLSLCSLWECREKGSKEVWSMNENIKRSKNMSWESSDHKQFYFINMTSCWEWKKTRLSKRRNEWEWLWGWVRDFGKLLNKKNELRILYLLFHRNFSYTRVKLKFNKLSKSGKINTFNPFNAKRGSFHACN